MVRAVRLVQASQKGCFSARMAHSCTPSCRTITMVAGGQLTLAIYTTRCVAQVRFISSCINSKPKILALKMSPYSRALLLRWGLLRVIAQSKPFLPLRLLHQNPGGNPLQRKQTSKSSHWWVLEMLEDVICACRKCMGRYMRHRGRCRRGSAGFAFGN